MEIYFQPWIGSRINDGMFGPRRVLALGESHYGECGRDATQAVVREYLETRTGRYWTMVMQMATGRRYWEMLDDEVHYCWHSLAHYNYIQESVGDGPRIRPTPEMWARAEAPFFRMLEAVQPTHIIVYGRELWHHMSNRGQDGTPLLVEGRAVRTWIYQYGDGRQALAANVDHPSFSGASVARANSVVQALLAA